MPKLTRLAGTAMLLLLSANPGRERFANYKAVETYEIRPGILMMPKYSADGLVCEVEIQRRHYSDGVVHLGSTIPHETVLKIIDEIAPASERGASIETLGSEYLSMYSGQGATSVAEYLNVSIEIDGQTAPVGFAGDVVVFIRWKNRPCQ
jgi:hypothetical protein